MKQLFSVLILFFATMGLQGQSKIPLKPLMEKYEYSHDLQLPQWGPYSKKYNGISHITSKERGYRFDLSFATGFFHRSKMVIPDVTQERDYFIWEVSPDLKYLGYNYQLEWKDKVKCDVSFSYIDSTSRFITVNFSNNTAAPQDVVYNLLAAMNYPRELATDSPVLPLHISLPDNSYWIDGMDYTSMDYATPRIDDNLIYDGFCKGEEYGSGMVDARALGRNFGKQPGDEVIYPVSPPNDNSLLVFRYRTTGQQALTMKTSGVLDEDICFEPSSMFRLKTVKVGNNKPEKGWLKLVSRGGSAIIIDGMAIVPEGKKNELTFEQEKFTPVPQIIEGPVAGSLLLKYSNTDLYYGILWEGPEHYIVEIASDNLSKLPQYNNRNIDEPYRFENNKGHFTDILVYGIELMPFAQKELNGLVCCGSKAEVEETIKSFRDQKKQHIEKRDEFYRPDFMESDNNPYCFAMKRMESVMANNLVFPIICQNEYIRHYTPGRRWNSLYTWDVGMIGIGMLEMDVLHSVNILNTYVTAPENPNAFIHHGTPVPTQIYLYQEIWNKTNDRDFLRHYYPRLKKYYHFLAGSLGSSITRMKSGLTKTWDYFYNSGGWDDYPPQRWVEHNDLKNLITPAITPTHLIRSAKIMRQAALELGIWDDLQTYEKDIELTTRALNKYSWDEKSGYFSYVLHNENEDAIGILRSDNGENMNMGMDGASPIIAGICNEQQRDLILEKLLDKSRLWTKLGISVDQQAPHAFTNAYDNETVWIAHQWFFWKTLLDLGYGQEAWDLANTALDIFSNEANRTYHCWEHYTQESLLGSGWHQFSGLNAPLVNWYHIYFKPGNIYGGFDFWIKSWTMNDKCSKASILFELEDLHRSKSKAILISLNSNFNYNVLLNGKKIPHKRITATTIQVDIPATQKENRIEVQNMKRGS